jgi:GTP pyrophosphokinase
MTIIDPADLIARVPGPSRLRTRWPPRADPAVTAAIAPLVAACHGADFAELRRAYEVAERLHRGQMRKSGAPYITHPLAVATILAGMGMDTTTLVAALLHDTVEDTLYTLGQVRADFGEEVAILVDGVTKLDGGRWGDRAEAETFRKIVLAAAADLRVLVIKLADRLHNLRTLGYKEPHKRERIARASLELLVPFAERLGIYAFKREMDDLAFAALDPDEHARTERAVAQALTTAGTLAPALEGIRAALAEQGVRARASLRPRHVYKVYRNMDGDLRGLRPSDVTRIMVLVQGGEQDCYIALGAVHSALHPAPGRVKDFIALPKFNFYQSLHTRVFGPSGDLLDVIIRSEAMHPVAEYGIVAHIQEAAGEAATADTVAGRRDLDWLGRLLAWEPDAPSADFLDGLRTDLRTGNIAVFDPAGAIVSLPAGATALDFAYAKNPETGDHCIGVVVNGRLTALSAELHGGDVVEVLTAPDATPSESWLEFARAAPTRVHIQRWLARRRADEAAERGRQVLVRALAERNLDLLAAESRGDSLAIARSLGYSEIDGMYAELATGGLDLAGLVRRFPG